MHEERPVSERREPVFLREELDGVRQGLEHAEGADAIWAEPVLPPTEQPTFPPDEDQRRRPASPTATGMIRM